MATNVEATVPYDTVAHFDRIAAKIENTLNPLIDQLIERKAALLQEVSQLRDDFHNKEAARLTAVQELSQTQLQLEQMSLKSNITIPVHEQAGLVYQHAKQRLSAPTPLPNLRFSCPSLPLLRTQIQQIGELVQLETPHLTQKRQPILTAGKSGEGENELDPAGLSLDEVNQKVYIADHSNNRVQVLSFQGEFLTHFGEEILKRPWGISVTDDHVFVTEYGDNTLSQFCKNSHQLLNRVGGEGSNEGQFHRPLGISVDTNGDVFVADFSNHRVCVFTKLFQYKQTIGKGSLSGPTDVKLTTDKVVVLDWSSYCIHFFSRSGDLLNSCVSQGKGNECLVSRPLFFALDCDCNILISDNDHHVVKIFSNSGEILHTIGKEGNEKGEFIEPMGIAISNSGVLFVASLNLNHSLQLF